MLAEALRRRRLLLLPVLLLPVLLLPGRGRPSDRAAAASAAAAAGAPAAAAPHDGRRGGWPGCRGQVAAAAAASLRSGKLI